MRKIALGVALGIVAALALSAVAAPPSSYVFRGLVGLVDAVSPATTAEGQMAMYRATPTGDHTCLLVDTNGAGYTASGGGGGGGTEYDEDTAHVSGDKLTMVGVVRADSIGALTNANGDRATLTVDPNNLLRARIDAAVDTELGAAVTPVDNMSQTAAPVSVSRLQAFDGVATQWDNVQSDGNGGHLVSLNPANTNSVVVDALSQYTPISGRLPTDSDTELPAAATLADNMANPDAPAVGAFTMVWDGAAWDRLSGTAGAGVLTNTELNGAASVADNYTPTSTSGVIGMTFGFDGSTWDRIPGNSTAGLKVDLGADNDVNLAQVNGATHSATNPVFTSNPCDAPTQNIYFRWASGTTPADQVLLAVSTTPDTADELVLCSYQVKCSGDNTSPVDITSLEADDTADVTLDSQDGVPAGGGWTGTVPLALGGDGRDLLLSAENPSDACVFTGVGYLR